MNLKKMTTEGPQNDWATFYTLDDTVVVADACGDRVMEHLVGKYVIGVGGDLHRMNMLVCADDKPVFRIRVFDAFAEARRFMSSLVLRGVTAKMRVIKIADKYGDGVL